MAGHHVSTMTSIWLPLIILLVCVDFNFVQGIGRYIPVFTNISALRNRYLPESFQIGQSLGKIVALDEDGTIIRYSIDSEGGEYFSVDSYSGEVILKKNLDYEFQIEIKSRLTATDQDNQKGVIECTSFVNDVNDNPPVFVDNTAIFRTISEDQPIGYTVAGISVTDLDTVNKVLSVTCDINNPSFTDACTTFNLVTTDRTNKYWRGNLILNRTLDYETRLSYNIRLIADDGDSTHDVSIEVHIEVSDVNDSPPNWAFAGPKAVAEEQPIGTSIQTLSATDGDISAPRQIFYEICGNNTNVFQIHSVTGVLSNAIRLDYDNSTHEKGVPYDICIKAREIINNITGELGNTPTTTATIAIKVTILDINDNGPEFSKRIYTANVNENTVSGANIPGLQMTVTDIDSGAFNSFSLLTLNNTDVFGIVPSEDAATSSATIYVKNGTLLDFETRPRQYTVVVRAMQNFQDNQMYTDTATVIINVLDVNDITPSFENSSYNATVSETAPPGTQIIDINAYDPEGGDFGSAGIRYKLYGDNIPPHFQINENTGVVTVAPCANQPGHSPCIDYERKQDYTLTVSATDNKGSNGSRTRSVQLFINVLDVNDNGPKIDGNYIRYINEDEMEPINPLLIEPIDPDTVGGPLAFTIANDNSHLWKITPLIDMRTNRTYGKITATRRVKYNDALYPSPEFNFAVFVNDQLNQATANVKIIVIDINDNSPEFSSSQYYITIPETTKGGVFVIMVTAFDADAPTTGNGVIDVYIQDGAQGKFTVANVNQSGTVFVADIFTTPGATFNYETKSSYTMSMIARDRGSPFSRFGNATVIVRISDENNKDPTIVPSFQTITVPENVPVGTSMYQVTARDLDINNKLAFSMTAVQATSVSGGNVSSTDYDFTNLFRIDENTGNVFVKSPLDRDKASRITFDLVVRDISANPPQRGNGTLLIHILEFNDNAPYFYLSYDNIIIDEEMNTGSFVLNLDCRDVDNKIAKYEITQNNPLKPEFFTLLQSSGAMVVLQPVDFEKNEVVYLTASCTDDGLPPLSNTTSIIVNIRNINDNTPLFSKTSYTATVLENTAGVYLLTVNATDLDKGDYGVVRYRLMVMDSYRYFAIDSITGEVTILPNATLDREKTPFLTFQAVAYDSPLDSSVRKSSAVPIYVTILDINDNCPVFIKTFNDVRIPESVKIGSIIADISISDADEGLNGLVVYNVKIGSGNPPEAENLFGIIKNNDVCRIYVKENLKGKIGSYSLNITATDLNGTSAGCTSELAILIVVQQSDNNAPEWIRPSTRYTVINVLESQYEGMLVYSSRALDRNVGPNGVIDYYFSITGNILTSSTQGFKMNNVTGVISAEVVFDREEKDIYYLALVAKDRGNPPASSETSITVVILDVNDNQPAYPMRDNVVTPKVLPPVDENIVIPANGRYYLGSCNATDADSDVENNHIYYQLVGSSAAVSDYILVDNNTCDIYLIKTVDYETTKSLQFDILAYNERYDASVKRAKREVKSNILPVSLPIHNLNDNPPTFMETSYLACVSIDAPYQQNIVQVSALDNDAGDNGHIAYSLSDTVAFQIDKNLGIISNIISFSESSSGQTIYRFRAYASDGVNNGTTTVTIFVTSPSNIARLKVNRPLSDVLPFKQQLIKALTNSSNGGIQFACINGIQNHVDENGQESSAAADVLISGFKYENGQYVPYTAADLVNYVDKERKTDASTFNAIYVTSAKEETKTDSFILKEDAVLAILIICILLIFLALLVLCIACICFRNFDRKKKKNIRAASHTIVHVKEEMESSDNPVYNVGGSEFPDDNAEYSTVKKVRPELLPEHPVVVPSHYVTSEADDVPPMEPPRTYLDDQAEPVIETFIDPEPVIRTHMEPEPVIETYLEPEPVHETYLEPEPVHETYLDPEPVIETYLDPEPVIERPPTPEPVHVSMRHFEPEYENRVDNDVDDHYHPSVAHHMSFPEPIEEDEMETSIRDSPIPSISSSYRGSPLPSPPASFRPESPGHDSE